MDEDQQDGKGIGGDESVGKNKPRINILHGREDLFPILLLPFQESLQVQELIRQHVVFQVRQPALVQGIDLKLQQLFLLLCEFGDPSFFVEFWRWRGGGT